MDSDKGAEKTVTPLQELCERAKIGDEARALLTGEFATKEFVGLLVQKELFRDALRLVAYLLPKREAVGWGCMCVRHILPSPKDQPLPETQAAAERWVTTPNEENRWAAKQAADQEKTKGPSALLAMAAFFAGPSMAPPSLQAVPPPDTASAEMVANVAFLAGAVKEPEKAKEKHAVFIQKALALAARLQQARQ